jgi:hypothetical protein
MVISNSSSTAVIQMNYKVHRIILHPHSFLRPLSLVHHDLPQGPIDSRLITVPLSLEPCDNVGVDSQRNRFLDRTVVSRPFWHRCHRVPVSVLRGLQAGNLLFRFGCSARLNWFSFLHNMAHVRTYI